MEPKTTTQRTDGNVTSLARVEEQPSLVRFAGPLSGDPEQVVEKATAIATTLGKLIREKGLSISIPTKNGPRDHVKAEGWSTLCAMLGVFPRTDWTRRIETKDGYAWEARVTFVHLASGREVCSGEAMCSPSEDRWEEADEYAVRSMAETRAMAKAARLGFAWIVTLAGFSPTPAEEMPSGERKGAARPNKFKGACVECGAFLEAGAGVAVQDAEGKWGPKHNPGACPPKEDSTALDAEIEGALTQAHYSPTAAKDASLRMSGGKIEDWRKLPIERKRAWLSNLVDAAAAQAGK